MLKKSIAAGMKYKAHMVREDKKIEKHTCRAVENK
jgi:hypothetical protein